MMHQAVEQGKKLQQIEHTLEIVRDEELFRFVKRNNREEET